MGSGWGCSEGTVAVLRTHEADPEPLLERTTRWILKHSFVATCRMSWAGHGGAPGCNEEAVVPPVTISSTKAIYILVALLFVLCQFVVGQPLADFIGQQAATFDAVLILVCADAATPNVLAFNMLRIVLQLATAVPICVLLWQEQCGVHQATKGSTYMLKKDDLSMPIYSVCKLLGQHRNQQEAAKSLNKVCGKLDYYRAPPPTNHQIYGQEVRDGLIKLCVDHYSFVDEQFRQQNHLDDDEMAAARSISSRLVNDFRNDLAFHNGDLRNPNGEHWCQRPDGTFCCRNKRDAIRKSRIHTANTTLNTGAPDYQPGRMLKQLPALQWCGRLECRHLRFSQMLSRDNFQDTTTKAPRGSEAAAVAELSKVRIRRSRERSEKPNFCADLLFNLQWVSILERLVVTLFGLSMLMGKKCDDSGRKSFLQKCQRRRRPVLKRPAAAARPAAAPAPGPDPGPGKSRLIQYMDAVEKLHVDIWEHVNNEMIFDVTAGPLGVQACFWQGTQADLCAKARAGYLALDSNIVMRFDEKFCEPPYSSGKKLSKPDGVPIDPAELHAERIQVCDPARRCCREKASSPPRAILAIVPSSLSETLLC